MAINSDRPYRGGALAVRWAETGTSLEDRDEGGRAQGDDCIQGLRLGIAHEHEIGFFQMTNGTGVPGL